MENPEEPIESPHTPTIEQEVYPPKFAKEEEAPYNIWLRSLGSLALYLILGFYIFHSFRILLLITAIVVIHELGHFFAMKMFRYKDLGIFFIPLLGAYVSGSKREVSQKESAIILLAGPVPGIIIGIVFFLLYQQNPNLDLASIPFDYIGVLFVFLNIINLLPIYPLDGGQLLNRVFLDEEGFLSWFALFGMSSGPVWPLLIFPAMMLLRLFGDTRLNNVEKKIETEGLNLDTSYEDMPDADYWKIRSVLVEEHPTFKDVPAGPPYEYNAKEERIMSTIQSLLHRHLIQDVSIVGKILIFLIVAAAFATPWLFKMDILGYFRFNI
jgi:stage IV sporulation protein FB